MLYAIVAVIALIIDQATKYWATVNIVVDTGEAKLIPGLIHLANVHNTGAAFSFLEGARWFFVILCIIFVLIVIYALSRDLITNKVCRWAAVFVMAGAIGNCIDRIVCGYVVDMFEFDFLIFKRPFPVFNFADILITVGVIVFCVALLLDKSATGGKKTAKAPSGRHVNAEPAPQAEPAPRPAPVKRPLIRHRQKVEIPEFPKHDLPDVAPLDPNDPFAEWEKRAKASKAASAPAPAEQPAAEIFTPVAAPAVTETPVIPAQELPVQPAVPAPKPAPEPAPEPAPAKPAAPDPAPAKPAAPEPAPADEFDLESILAEFKDL